MPNNQSNKLHLGEIIQSLELLSSMITQHMASVKNISSEHIYCSQYWAEEMGMPLEDIIGKIVCDKAYGYETSIAAQIITEDQLVIQNNKPILTLKVNAIGAHIQPYYCLKSPIQNPDTKDVIGILCQGFHFGTPLQKHMPSPNDSPTHSPALPTLTKREKEVVYLFLGHLSSQEIAETLSTVEKKPVSKSTIDSIINDKLYKKFQFYSLPALLQTLLKQGYACRIPQSLLKIQSTIIGDMKVY